MLPRLKNRFVAISNTRLRRLEEERPILWGKLMAILFGDPDLTLSLQPLSLRVGADVVIGSPPLRRLCLAARIAACLHQYWRTCLYAGWKGLSQRCVVTIIVLRETGPTLNCSCHLKYNNLEKSFRRNLPSCLFCIILLKSQQPTIVRKNIVQLDKMSLSHELQIRQIKF